MGNLPFRDRRPHLVYLFFNKTRFTKYLKDKMEDGICGWLNLVCFIDLLVFIGFFSCFALYWRFSERSNWNPPTELNLFKKISHNSWSERKKFNLLNRSIVWPYIDDRAVLSPPCIRSLEGRNSVSLELGIPCAALPFAALPTAGTAPPWAGMLASTRVQQALSQDRKDPCGTFKAESSIC